MTTIEKQVVIARPIEEVVRFTGDWHNIPKYLDYIQAVKPLTEKTKGEGARLFVNLTFLGRRMSTEWETIEYRENEGWTFKVPLMGIEAHKRWRFEPVGESTRASFTLEYDPKPAVVAPLADVLLIRRRWDRIYERGMQNLKRLIESEPAEEVAVV
ncbi:MAG: SRPBCC family protein [bacterium]